MKQYKKRTIALVLASVITVAGSFAASNYKNSLMSLNFASDSNGSVNMIVKTKTAYEGNLSLVRKDLNTYVLTLPEVNSFAPTPELNAVGNIESVNIRTMPYSNGGNGYTRVTVKTLGNTLLNAKNEIYIPSAEQKAIAASVNPVEEVQRPEPQREVSQSESPSRYQERVGETRIPQQTNSVEREKTEEQYIPEHVEESTTIEEASPVSVRETKDPTEGFLLVLGIFLILTSVVYFYIKAKNKLADIAGEQINLEVDEKPKKPEKKTTKDAKKIRSTIKQLDSKYPRSSVQQPRGYTSPIPTQIKVPIEEVNIVDLDELFQEKLKSEAHMDLAENDDENEALEDFLSGFSFDEPEEVVEEIDTVGYDEEFYEKILSEGTLKFSAEDVVKINDLLNMEISDSTLRDKDKYLVSNPIVQPVSKDTILENLITEYTILQNISFTADDVNALYKLISVEIDKDFVTDLRTNPKRAKEMEAEILRKKSKPHKTSETLTLNVKDMLPDLSEALRKQGGRKIESEVKPTTVYYSEGYEYQKLSLEEALPDLSVEINRKGAFVSKPSAKVELVATGYEYEKLSLTEEMPDLQDVLLHPEKYEEPEPEEVVVDEEALLNNISNVQFKPFYDGTEEFEVINNFEDEDAPSVDDIQKEMSEFDNFVIAEEENISVPQIENEYDDFEALYNEEFVDLDKEIKQEELKVAQEVESEPVLEEIVKPETIELPKPQPKIERPVVKTVEYKRTEKSAELLQKIEQKRQEREIKRAEVAAQKAAKIEAKPEMKKSADVDNCIVRGRSYKVISSVAFAENSGCYLAKNDKGYQIIGYIGDRLLELKQYSELKSEKIQARLSEKLEDGALRYLVRIGLKKFILDVSENDIHYVMDLC